MPRVSSNHVRGLLQPSRFAEMSPHGTLSVPCAARSASERTIVKKTARPEAGRAAFYWAGVGRTLSLFGRGSCLSEFLSADQVSCPSGQLICARHCERPIAVRSGARRGKTARPNRDGFAAAAGGRGGLLQTAVNRKPPNRTVDLSLVSSRENIGDGSVPSANGSFRSHLHRDMWAKPRAHPFDRWEAINLRPAGTGVQESAPL